jgi:hypothetical protein
MAFNVETLTAKLYPKDSRQYAGTAWLCSRQYVLTAAHCVIDRENPQKELGPFRLVFPWGELECETQWWNFESDAALLRVTSGQIEKMPIQIDDVLSWLEAPESLEENDRAWSAYGFPAAKPGGMIIDGKINLINGNIYGAVENYPAIQLTCDQVGFVSRKIINPRTGEPQEVSILGGVSGSAVMYQGRILGLVRWGPPEFGQKVIYATSLSSIASQCQQVAEVLIEHQRNYLSGALKLWSVYEGTTRKRLNEEELEDHLQLAAINSPLMELWNENFIQRPGWHEEIGTHLQSILDRVVDEGPEFAWLIKRLETVDCALRYERVLENLKKLLSLPTFTKLSEIELRFTRSRTRAQKSGLSMELEALGNVIRAARELSIELNKLKRSISPPLFSRCFLVSGSRGAGKSHFLASLLSNADASAARTPASIQKDEGINRGYLLLPLGFPPVDEQLEEAILDEVEKAATRRWRSLDEVNRFIDEIGTAWNSKPKPTYSAGDTVRIKSGPWSEFTGKVEEVKEDASTRKAVVAFFGSPPLEFDFSEVENLTFTRRRMGALKLVIAIDNLEQWIEREPGFDDRLTQFIANHSHLSHIYWLITLHDASYDKVSKNSFWRRYGNVYSITDASLQKKSSYWPNIDGWLALDEFNLSERFGLKIIQAMLQKEGAEETGPSVPVEALKAYDESSPTVRYLSNPFLAWITLDMLWSLEESVFDLRFIEFIEHFWEKRRGSLNPAPVLSWDQLDQAIELIATVLPEFPNLSTSLPKLLDEVTGQAGVYNYEIKQRELAGKAINILLKNNLLKKLPSNQSSGPGFSRQEIVEMDLAIFWEYAIATRFQKGVTTDSPKPEAEAIWQELRGLGSNENLGEGVAIFLLLLLDRQDENQGLIEELLRLAMDSRGQLAAAIWFAGAKISLATQRLLLRISHELPQQKLVPERRALFAYMSFISEASPEALDAETRLASLQPYYQQIQEAALTPYFVFLAERLFRTIGDAETMISCMLRLTGCEVLERTRGLAALAFDRLEEIVRDEEDPESKALDIVIRYLQSLSRSGVVAQDNHERVREPYYFRENLLNELCRRLVFRRQLGAYYLLANHDWYKPQLLQIEEPIAQEMQQQANIALGAWYRHVIVGKKRYMKLIKYLMKGELADRVVAFYLVRHTITMRGPQTVRVDRSFRPVLEKILHDPQMQEIVNKYYSLFVFNRPRRSPVPDLTKDP